MVSSKCQCDPALKEMWGCEKSTQAAVWIDCDDNEYYICPVRLITDDILDWYDSYVYYQEFGGAPRYEDQSSKYLEAYKIYKYYLQHYIEETMPKPKDGYAIAKQTLKGK